MKLLFTAMIICAFSFFLYADDIEIDHAYLRKLSEYDNGTIHLFLKNNCQSDVRIKNIYLNDELLIKLPDELAVWEQAVPNPIPPQKISDIMVKLKYPASKLMKIEAELEDGRRFSRVIQPINPPLRFTFVGFNESLDKLYIYIMNTGDTSISLNKLYLDSQDITDLVINPILSINPQKKECIIVKLKNPLRWGDYITLKLEKEEEPIAETQVRVYRYFPIQAWDEDKRNTLLMPYPKSKEEFKMFQNAPLHKAYHVLNDPACKDSKKGILGKNAQKVIYRAKVCRKDKIHTSAIYMCEHEKPRSYFIYGETTDLIMANPYEFAYNKEKPEKDGYFIGLAKLASEPRPLFAISEAFMKKTTDGANRFPTPEELRLIVYGEIAQGAKGIFYFKKHYTEGQGYEKSPELETEIKGINKELQELKDYLIIGEPMPLAQTDNPRVEAHAILCGDKGIVLILIDKDYQSFFEKPPYFLCTPKENFKITVNLPTWLKIKKIYELKLESEPLKFNNKKGQVILGVECVNIVKILILIAK